MSSDRQPSATRRTVVWGACAAALTACAGGRAPTPPPSASPAPLAGPTPTAAVPAPPPPTTAAPALAAMSDVPVGGGRVFPDYRLVITRPSAGELKAFTAICTHDGCLLTAVADKTINCPCHGSRFAIADGAVVRGPALRALTPRTITVRGGSIYLNP